MMQRKRLTGFFELRPFGGAAAGLLVVTAMEANSQGIISFYNSGHDLKAVVTDSRTGERLAGRDWLGQLYYSPIVGASESLLVPAPGLPAFFATGFQAGFFDLSQDLVRVLPDVAPAEGISVQLRVWNAAAGSTFEEAMGNPIGVVGKSYVGLGSTGIPGLTPGAIRDLQPFSVYSVPEPSFVAILFCGWALVGLPRHWFARKNGNERTI